MQEEKGNYASLQFMAPLLQAEAPAFWNRGGRQQWPPDVPRLPQQPVREGIPKERRVDAREQEIRYEDDGKVRP